MKTNTIFLKNYSFVAHFLKSEISHLEKKSENAHIDYKISK